MAEIVDVINTALHYLPTAIVTLVLGIIAQRVIRAGKRDEIALQREANAAATRLGEADLVIASLKDDVKREHDWRVEAEGVSDRLRELVVGQVALEAHRTEIEPPS